MLSTALLCLVVGVSDGATMNIRCATTIREHPYQHVTVRLAEIDAPKQGQPYGPQSKQHLSNLCLQVEAAVRPSGTDRTGRLIARVECRGEDANLAMVRSGLAWAYNEYRTDPVFAKAELDARAARIGIWSKPGPSAPW